MTTLTTDAALLTTATYAEAHARLAAIAAKLKGPASATSIDALAQDVREARAAYRICKARLEAIRSEIEGEDLED